MNNELERVWKKVVMASFKVISRHLLGGTEENCVKPVSQYPVSGLKIEPEMS
jgi:hypothetical protein